MGTWYNIDSVTVDYYKLQLSLRKIFHVILHN